MASNIVLSLVVYAIFLVFVETAQEGTQFIYNGFKDNINNLHLDGLAKVNKNGLLQLTDFTEHKTSHAFYSNPVTFNRKHLSFSTTYVFAIHPKIINYSGHGIAFVISPDVNLQNTSLAQEYLGLFNSSSNGQPSNNIFAVELDTMQNAVFKDINDNHVGIDVNSLTSVYVASASYYSDKERRWKALSLTSGKPMRVWIDYDGAEMLINVTIGPIDESRPSTPLLSKYLDLSTILLDSMYIGFSSATGLVSNSHFILGWSWNQSGNARDLDPSQLPSLPKFRSHHRPRLNQVIVAVMIILLSLAVFVIGGVAWFVRKKRYEELHEPWEQIYTPHRISYKDLFTATKGFSDSELLGVGGFGKVYKGVLPSTGVSVAVKRISHDSRQGMKEFVAEVASMKRLNHRNLVQLLGYCRRKGELLLVYEYMFHGSLDKFLFTRDERSKLSWFQRFKIVKGIASALLYLHEEWEEVVLHRDVKASNVLLDVEMNARLGDFGLARLYDHGDDPRTTNLVGTMGFIAPEANRTRAPSTRTDVFAFGMFLFEVGCGRRPIDPQADSPEDVILIDWVYHCWKKGEILEASDPKLEGDYVKEEMELILRLGLLCSNPKADARPTMRQAVWYLNHTLTLPDIPYDYNPEDNDFLVEGWGASSLLPSSSFPPPSTVSFGFASSTDSILHSGR